MTDVSTSPIDGFVLVHEHLSIDYGQKHGTPTSWDEGLRDQVIAVLQRLASLGCAALVDCTPPGYGRDLKEMRAASAATGLTVYAATGSFCEQWSPLPDFVAASDVETLARHFSAEVDDPLGGSHQSIIKTATSADRITEAENRVLRAAARASRRTNARIVSHTSRGMGLETLDLFANEGLPLDRILISHVCANGEDAAYAEQIARQGAFVGFDRIGHAALSDEDWLELIRHMAERGLLGQVLLSHDSVQRFLGPAEIASHTFDAASYIPEQFVPRMLAHGFSNAEVRQLLVKNGTRWLRQIQ